MADRLNGYRILILETREEAQFSRLLTEQGADVLQCPMFTIHDAPDPAPVEAWIGRCIEKPFDDVVLMTGEGLRRLMKVVRRMDAAPRVGILQAATRPVNRKSLFARIQQFAAGLYAPLITDGLDFWLGKAAPYWGHNAIIRLAPFMRHCGGFLLRRPVPPRRVVLPGLHRRLTCRPVRPPRC